MADKNIKEENVTVKKRMIKMLSFAFENEYADVFLYLKEAELFKKKIVSGDRIGRIFTDFSLMELRHADRVASKLIELGSKATWTFKPLEQSASLRDVLKRHLENETRLIKVYDEILALCDDVDLKITVKGIRENEKEHFAKVSHILKHLK